MSSGYGSQPLLETPVSSEDSISLQSGASNEETTTASVNDVSIVEKLSSMHSDTLEKPEHQISNHQQNGNTSPAAVRSQSNSKSANELMYSDNDNDSLSSYGSRTDFVSVGDNSVNNSSTQLPEWLTIGESVRISPDYKTGVVAFIGTTHFASGVWVGVALDSPQGKNNGSVNGVQYFSCKQRYGIFVRPEKLKLDYKGRTMRLAKANEVNYR
ncbi:Kinesin-like protein KIF13A [Dinothrombium tinctorium]|uniref:Kinesin-like protein KIF13A n=1 Tax=Dinothrombium tinctorium TaxID=1965070 RepID=A0A3S3PLM5_9ACAR|nr:Kinesin-like protein KIF13A [Dinothrombium tinctorium]